MQQTGTRTKKLRYEVVISKNKYRLICSYDKTIQMIDIGNLGKFNQPDWTTFCLIYVFMCGVKVTSFYLGGDFR